MGRPADAVRAFFESMEARDWLAAGTLLSPSVHIEFTETGERFDGPNFSSQPPPEWRRAFTT